MSWGRQGARTTSIGEDLDVIAGSKAKVEAAVAATYLTEGAAVGVVLVECKCGSIIEDVVDVTNQADVLSQDWIEVIVQLKIELRARRCAVLRDPAYVVVTLRRRRDEAPLAWDVA